MWSFVGVLIAGAALEAHSTPMPQRDAIPRAARRATAVMVHRSVERPVEPSLTVASPGCAGARSNAKRCGEWIDEPRFVQHVESIAKLIGHPARELAERLGAAAKVDTETIEWDLADAGIAAGATYALATIVDGKMTGVVFRGRSTEEILHRLRPRLSLQLTMAGGDRPSFSIVGGE